MSWSPHRIEIILKIQYSTVLYSVVENHEKERTSSTLVIVPTLRGCGTWPEAIYLTVLMFPNFDQAKY